MRWLVVLGVLLAGCAIPAKPRPPVEDAWMSLTFASLAPDLLRFACLSDKAYPHYQMAPSAQCDALIPEKDVRRRAPGVPSRGDTADYAIVYDDGKREQYLAIRGTDAKRLEDILIDADLSKPETNDNLGVRMHSGFREYALAVLADLKENPDLLRPGYKTVVAGHSLGGAAALLVALELHFAKPHRIDIDAVFTYGQPRVFDNAGAIAWPDFARHIYRVVNCRDPVPLAPRGNGLLDNIFDFRTFGTSARDYQHIGQEILLMDRGGYWISGDVDVWRDFHGEVDSMVRNLIRGQPIDHAIRTYEFRIAQAMEAANDIKERKAPGSLGPLYPADDAPCTDVALPAVAATNTR